MRDQVLDALVAGTVRVTGGSSAWVLVPDVGGLAVAASTLPDPPDLLRDTAGSAAELVLRTGQPLSSSAVAGAIVTGLEGVLPTAAESVLCLPCHGPDATVGVLVVVDKLTGSFTVDDVEVVEVLAGIAGATLGGADRGRGPDG